MDKQRTKVVYPFVKRRPREEEPRIVVQYIQFLGSSAGGATFTFLTKENSPTLIEGGIRPLYLLFQNVVTASILTDTIITTGSSVRVD